MAGPKSAQINAAAKKAITKPSKSARLPRILIYSRNKKGKTAFGLTAPNVLMVDPEHGTDHFQNKDPDVWHVGQWTDLDDVYKFCRYGDHSYEWVNLDGLTRMANMSLKFVMSQAEEQDLTRKPGLVQQRDYGKAGELVKQMLYNFHTLNMGVILSTQERVETNEFEEEDDDAETSQVQYVPDLPKGVRSSVNSIVDVIGRLYIVKTDDEPPVSQRRLWIEPSTMYDTGYRSEFVLPPYLKNPTVPRLLRAIRTGSAAAPKKGTA